MLERTEAAALARRKLDIDRLRKPGRVDLSHLVEYLHAWEASECQLGEHSCPAPPPAVTSTHFRNDNGPAGARRSPIFG